MPDNPGLVRRVLVTAGNTRERIDDVRDWGNIFTGNTGFLIALALGEAFEVDLLTSNRQHIAELVEGRHGAAAANVHPMAFTSHAELRAALGSLMLRHRYHAVFMTAAVADYQPAGAFAIIERRPGASSGEENWVVRDVQAGKVKSTHREIAIVGRQTEKLVDLFRTEWKHTGLLVKFKLEVGISREELIRIGQASRRASGADFLVANTLDMVGGETAGAYLLSEGGHEWVPRPQLAARMRVLMEEPVSPATPHP